MSNPLLVGIYQIKNTKTGECYVGSSLRIYDRLKAHMVNLLKGTHINMYLLQSWKQYGPESFDFSILEIVTDDKVLSEREIFWIRATGARDRGFNTKTDSYKRHTVMSVGAELKSSLESLQLGSMNDTLQQLIESYIQSQQE